MKRIISLLLTLAMLLSMSGAYAEPYIAGQRTQQLLTDAFDAGKRIGYEFSYDVALDGASIGLSDEETQALTRMYNEMKFDGGVTRLADGLRIDFTMVYLGQNIDGMLDLTTEGLALRSDSIIPGQVFTAKWPTLLTRLGMDAATAEQLNAIIMNWETLLPELMAQAEALIAQIVPLVQPYAQAATQYIEQFEPKLISPVTPAEGYPAAMAEIAYTFTDKDIGGLLLALVDVLEQDQAMQQLLTQLLAYSGAQVTGEQLVAALREGIGETFYDETSSYTILFGYDEDAALLYAMFATQIDEDNALSAYIGAGDTPNSLWMYVCNTALSTQEVTGFEFHLDDAVADDGTENASFRLALYAGETISMAMDMTLTPITGEDGLPGSDMQASFSFTMPVLEMIMSMEQHSSLTADGGERTIGTASMNMTMQGTSFPMDMTIEQIATPADNGDLTITSNTTTTMSTLGQAQMSMNATVTARDAVAPAALTAVALETATQEELIALLQTAQTNLQAFAAGLSDGVSTMLQTSSAQ